jgi:hypothetical protein
MSLEISPNLHILKLPKKKMVSGLKFYSVNSSKMSREIWLKYWGSFDAPKFLGKNLGKYDDFLGKFQKIIWHHWLYGCSFPRDSSLAPEDNSLGQKRATKRKKDENLATVAHHDGLVCVGTHVQVGRAPRDHGAKGGVAVEDGWREDDVPVREGEGGLRARQGRPQQHEEPQRRHGVGRAGGQRRKCKFKLNEKLSELEKLIGIDPLIERSLIMIKRLNILRKQLYDFNHQVIKLR